MFALLSIQLAYAETIGGRVVSIADGDTITVLTPENKQVRIRLTQIDAPEKSQDFGQASKQSLSSLVFGKDVLVQAEGLDKYGRTLWKVPVGGVDANLEQVKAGLAWVYVKYAHDPAYFAAEASAKKPGWGFGRDRTPSRHGSIGTAGGKPQPRRDWDQPHPSWPMAVIAAASATAET